MPTYEFRCPDGHEFERFYRKISDATGEVACPECGKPAVRKLSGGAGLHFKGSGFYLTDYGKNAHRNSGGATGSGEAKSGEAKSEKSGETKSSDAKSSDAKPGESKSAESTSGSSKPSESKSSGTAGGSSSSDKATDK